MTNYAPQYNSKEKLAKYALYVLLIIAFAIIEFTLLPWLSKHQPCISSSLIAQGFAARPLFYLFIIIIAFLIGLKDNLNIIRLKQYPLPAQKTFRKIEYCYGLKATYRAYLSFIVMLSAIVFFISMNLYTHSLLHNLASHEINTLCSAT